MLAPESFAQDFRTKCLLVKLTPCSTDAIVAPVVSPIRRNPTRLSPVLTLANYVELFDFNVDVDIGDKSL